MAPGEHHGDHGEHGDDHHDRYDRRSNFGDRHDYNHDDHRDRCDRRISVGNHNGDCDGINCAGVDITSDTGVGVGVGEKIEIGEMRGGA